MTHVAIDSLRKSIIEYCVRIGADPLLVQGAGGNVSWKENDILWIKASGTWLAEAKEKDIFVSVDLPHLINAIHNGDFSVTPQSRGESSLRPSIETLLHALMPQRVVVHVHAIEVLAHLVRDSCQDDFCRLLDQSVPWVVVDYHKPGAPLAKAISIALTQNPLAKIVFLKNHGVVVGGENIEEVNTIIVSLVGALSIKLEKTKAYVPINDKELHQLALNSNLFNRLVSSWALYPDHVVFLGPKAHVYKTWEEVDDELPELIFISDQGVYVKPSFSQAKQLQLRCYYDVIVRQAPESLLKTLTQDQIAELLNWDAEQYRINLAK